MSESLSPKTVESMSNDNQIHEKFCENSSQNADGMQSNAANAPPITPVHQMAASDGSKI
ncbi:MAG: hypothetical protein ACK53Y_21180 [bacterium]